MSLYNMDARSAEDVAIKFLRQQYSSIDVIRSVLQDGGRVWLVEVIASSFDNQRKIRVQVNARTGLILGWQ
jgi:hypothetical protein